MARKALARDLRRDYRLLLNMREQLLLIDVLDREIIGDLDKDWTRRILLSRVKRMGKVH